jgi:pectate lyase
VDHCDLSSVPYHVEDSDTSLLGITRGSDRVTVTATVFRNHSLAVSVGHSDANASEDRGKLHVTFARNYFHNVGNAISFRFGTGHVLNSFFENATDGVNTRMGAQLLVESSVFEVQGRAVFTEGSIEAGYATVQDALLGSSSNTAPPANMTVDSLPYPYDWYIWDKDQVRGFVTRQAGQTLEFLPATPK